MSQYVTIPGWRRSMLGQGVDFGTDPSAPSVPDIFPVDGSGDVFAQNYDPFATPITVTPAIAAASAPSSPLYDAFGTVGGPSTSTPLQTVNWGNGVTGTYDKASNTFYDSNGNPLSGSELAQYGSFTIGGPASGVSLPVGSGIAAAIAKIFSPSPAAGVPPAGTYGRPGVATVPQASIFGSLGTSLSSLILPIAAIAAIALVLGKRR